MSYFSVVDLFYGPLFLFGLIIYGRVTKYSRVEKFPEYEYFSRGLYCKLLGGLSLCFIYAIYYGGGDTLNYFRDATLVSKLLISNPGGFVEVMLKGNVPETKYIFTSETGFPLYKDQPTFFVVRVAAPIVLLSGGSFIVTTLIFALMSFFGNWRLYKVFITEFPDLKKEMAIAFLFIPSVFFWGSGLLKDTITLSCIGFYTYSFYKIFILREKFFSNAVVIFLASFLILQIKPYIIFALLPGSIIWIVNKQVIGMKNKVIKFLTGPFLLSVGVLGGYLLLANMSGLLGLYSLDSVLDRAVITNQDLKADYYKGNSVDIGEFEATIPSMLSKAPVAINLALFRPYLWEANNLVMLISGLECFIMMIFTIRVLIKTRLFGAFPIIYKNHLLSFALIFSLFFAFSVGISTSNFGSLVRYRIPVLPFFIASMYIIRHLYIKKQQEADA
ncbi:MAG: hypothetical protein ACK5C5_05630 [Bacteroidota bacterium]|jgi:hypothetical protein